MKVSDLHDRMLQPRLIGHAYYSTNSQFGVTGHVFIAVHTCCKNRQHKLAAWGSMDNYLIAQLITAQSMCTAQLNLGRSCSSIVCTCDAFERTCRQHVPSCSDSERFRPFAIIQKPIEKDGSTRHRKEIQSTAKERQVHPPALANKHADQHKNAEFPLQATTNKYKSQHKNARFHSTLQQIHSPTQERQVPPTSSHQQTHRPAQGRRVPPTILHEQMHS